MFRLLGYTVGDPSASEGERFAAGLSALGRLFLVGSEWGSYAAPVSGSGARAGGSVARTALREAGEEAGERLARQGAKQAAQEIAEEVAQRHLLRPKRFSRYMSEAELKAIQETGLLRGGREGPTYFTTHKFRKATTAMRRLSLPQKPEIRVDFEIINNPTILGPRPAVPAYGQPGGGIELWTENKVMVRILRAIRLK